MGRGVVGVRGVRGISGRGDRRRESLGTFTDPENCRKDGRVCQAWLSAVCRITSGPRGLHSSGQMLLNLLLRAGCW